MTKPLYPSGSRHAGQSASLGRCIYEQPKCGFAARAGSNLQCIGSEVESAPEPLKHHPTRPSRLGDSQFMIEYIILSDSRQRPDAIMLRAARDGLRPAQAGLTGRRRARLEPQPEPGLSHRAGTETAPSCAAPSKVIGTGAANHLQILVPDAKSAQPEAPITPAPDHASLRASRLSSRIMPLAATAHALPAIRRWPRRSPRAGFPDVRSGHRLSRARA